MFSNFQWFSHRPIERSPFVTTPNRPNAQKNICRPHCTSCCATNAPGPKRCNRLLTAKNDKDGLKKSKNGTIRPVVTAAKTLQKFTALSFEPGTPVVRLYDVSHSPTTTLPIAPISNHRLHLRMTTRVIRHVTKYCKIPVHRMHIISFLSVLLFFFFLSYPSRNTSHTKCREVARILLWGGVV